MQGWVSIHRKIKNNPVWQDPKLLKLWMLCLLEASHKEHEQLVGRQIVKLKPGEFVTGRFALAEEYNKGMKKSEKVNERTLWRWMKNLEDGDFLSIKSTTKYSVISIKNWDFYQNGDHQMSNKRPSNVQQVSTNNNGNNVNNENNNAAVAELPPSSDYERIKNTYMRLAGIGGFEVSAKDQQSISTLMTYEIPVDKVIKWLEECFKEYNPKHKFDKINSFAYCLPRILDKYVAEQEGNKGGQIQQYRRGTSRPAKENREPILGDFVGRVPRRKV